MAGQFLSQADIDALVSSLARGDPAGPVANVSDKTASGGTAPKTATAAVARATIKVPNASSQMAQSQREQKSGMVGERVNNADASINDLAKYLAQISVALKRIEQIEKRVAFLETHLLNNGESPDIAQRLNNFDETLKNILRRLKGTPGYGVRWGFSCEKCNDRGHLAIMYRCTKCGHERWYGWLPDKQPSKLIRR